MGSESIHAGTTPSELSGPAPELNDALKTHPYAAFLPKVTKPGRYLGGEEQAIIKDHAGKTCRFVLAFPDLYEVGMSHLGTRIIYNLVNGHDDLVCERAFSPWPDMEAELRERALPLVSLETYRPLGEFDVIGVSLQYELSYTNVLLNLDLGGVPIRSDARNDSHPIVIAGGPTCTHPEPIADFIDLFLVGEAEDVLVDALRTIGRMRAEGKSRVEIIATIARQPGFYAPRFYTVAEEPQTGMLVVDGLTEEGRALGIPETVQRVFVRDLDAYPFPTNFPVPYAEAIFDRTSVEITRGCTEGCRFCQAGMIYRPVRERKPEDVIKAVLDGTDAAGFDETSLTALSTADVSCIDPLIKQLVPELAKRKVSLGIASLRAYGLNEDMLDEIQRVGIDGLTFAPEAGTQRMRDVINKNVSDEDILASAKRIFERGMDRMKMYFIMGLPTETDEDVAGIVETGRKVRQLAGQMQLPRMPKITVSVSQHVPKPHTPFQWAAMDTMEDLHSKVHMLRNLARDAKVSLKTHEVRDSWLECLFARGDRRMCAVLETAYKAGARFDGWREVFSFERWLDALEAHEVDPNRYTRTLPLGVPLPWSHLDMGMEPDFLESEYKKSLRSRISPPCGKPAGAQVHHTSVEAAVAETKRLVCYDCGVACDLSEMKHERLDALRSLEVLAHDRAEDDARDAEVAARRAAEPQLVPLSRLKGRLGTSELSDNSAFKENAVAPFSRVRIFFAKEGTAAFLGHLDLVRIFPRMFRRAGVELSFRRGFNPQPRMTFGPALALGMSAQEEVVDVDLILPRSPEDMDQLLTAEERAEIGADLLARISKVAPPGIRIFGARLLEGGEKRLGELVAGADYAVALDAADSEAERVRAHVDALLARETLPIERTRKAKKKKSKGRRRGGPPQEETITIDMRPQLAAVYLDPEGKELRFRLRSDMEGATVRPREAAAILVGAPVDDHKLRRARLLGVGEGGELEGLQSLGVVYRDAERLVGDPAAKALRERMAAEREA